MDVIDLWELLSYVDGLSFETYPWDLFYLCHPSVNSAEFEFGTPEKECLNAAELQHEWTISNPIWDEKPSTSSSQHGEGMPNRDLSMVLNAVPETGMQIETSHEVPSTSSSLPTRDPGLVGRSQSEISSKTGEASQDETDFNEAQRNDDNEIISFNHVPLEEVPSHQVVQISHSNQTFLSENSNDYQNALESSDAGESKDESLDQSSLLIDTSTDIQNNQSLQESMLKLQLSLEDRSALSAFEKLSKRNPDESMDVAKLPENASKNRYKDVLPYDSSRVILKEGTDGDYINASFVHMPLPHPRKPNEYIAAQGPLPQTCNDFWQVIWEQSVGIVVMVTPLKERNRVKCHQYWPDLYQTESYNEMQVTCFSETTSTTGITRDFLISHQKVSEERHVIQLQYVNWPDHGVPVDCTDFLEFVQQFRDLRRDVGGTVLVHCSAGVGRTGVLILMETALAYMDADEPIFPLELLKTMRNQRVMMVQTVVQYKFICEALLKAYNDRCKKMKED